MADDRPYQSNSAHSVRPAAAAPVPPKALPPLTEAEHGRITKTIAFAKENLPEMVQLVKDLHAEGLIEGWRALTIEGIQ